MIEQVSQKVKCSQRAPESHHDARSTRESTDSHDIEAGPVDREESNLEFRLALCNSKWLFALLLFILFLASICGLTMSRTLCRHRRLVAARIECSEPEVKIRSSSKKEALLITCTYGGSKGDISRGLSPLPGCADDGDKMNTFLQKKGFNVTWLRDFVNRFEDPRDYQDEFFPSASNIKRHIKKLVNDREPGDVIWLHYSGHGCQLNNQPGNADTADGNKDEAIVSASCGHPAAAVNEDVYIRDDWLKDYFVKQVPDRVECIAIFDCCHSGTNMDIKYKYDDGEDTDKWSWKDTRPNEPESGGFILKISACQDRETAKELTFSDGTRGGALTLSFLECLRKHKDNDPSVKDLIQYIDDKCEVRKQRPSLSTTRKDRLDDLNMKFSRFWDGKVEETESKVKRQKSLRTINATLDQSTVAAQVDSPTMVTKATTWIKSMAGKLNIEWDTAAIGGLLLCPFLYNWLSSSTPESNLSAGVKAVQENASKAPKAVWALVAYAGAMLYYLAPWKTSTTSPVTTLPLKTPRVNSKIERLAETPTESEENESLLYIIGAVVLLALAYYFMFGNDSGGAEEPNWLS